MDVATVAEQDLCSVADPTLIEICRVEDRWLISFDTDFANTLRFPPSRYRGITVLRLHEPVSLSDIESALIRIARLAETRSPIGRLWIVSLDRIREYSEQ
jgi:predicted nuclease of predicted toxin-antitoxin system